MRLELTVKINMVNKRKSFHELKIEMEKEIGNNCKFFGCFL